MRQFLITLLSHVKLWYSSFGSEQLALNECKVLSHLEFRQLFANPDLL